jgi:hypothetical protein
MLQPVPGMNQIDHYFGPTFANAGRGLVTFLYLSGALLVFQSCKKNESTKLEKSFSMETIPSYQDLKGEKHFFEQIKMPNSLLIKNDTLIVSDISNDAYLFHLIETRTFGYLYPKGVVGYGPGEMGSYWAIDPGLKENTFWAYSLEEKVLSEYKLSDSTDRHAVRQIRPRGAEAFFLGVTWSSDSTLMSYLAQGKEKLVEFTLDGQKLKGYGKWEGLIPGNYPDHIIADLHQGRLKGNVKTQQYLKASILRDRLELLDKNSGLILGINGPLNEIPHFSISGPGVVTSSDAPLAYMDAFLGDKYIYGLYSGKTDKEIMKEGRGETRIFVFDMKGNIQICFNLDTPIRSFTVDENHQRIFGVTEDEEPGIVTFDYAINME